jgi:RPA family protein
MYAKRATAAKLSIQDIQDGEFIANERGNVVGVNAYLGQISRVNIIATVVDRYTTPQERLDQGGKKFAAITLDDGTGVIRVMMWDEMSAKLADIGIGDLVLAVGKVRSFQGEAYINGEVIRKLEDPNWETVRLIELANSRRDPHILEGQVETTVFDMEASEEATQPPKQMDLEPGVWHNATKTLKRRVEDEEEPVPSPELRRRVIQTIEKYDSEGGARFEQILDATGEVEEEVVEQVLIDLLSEGLVYEPEIHRYKKS